MDQGERRRDGEQSRRADQPVEPRREQLTARQRFTFSGVLLAALLVVSLLTGCAGVRLHECTLPDQPKWAMALEPLPEIDGRSLMTRISEWKKSGQRQSLLAVLAGWFSATRGLIFGLHKEI